MVCVLDRWILTRWTLVCLGNDTSQKCCGLVLHRHSRLFVRNRTRLLDFLSWPCHLRPSHAFPPQFFRVLLLRRLWLPLPLSSRICPLLCRKRCCKGARVSTNLFVGTWICQSHFTMVDDWKSWLTGFCCSMVLSSRGKGRFLFASATSHGTQQEVSVAGRHPGGNVAHHLAWSTSSIHQVGDAQQVRRVKIPQHFFEGSVQEGSTSIDEAGAGQNNSEGPSLAGQQDTETPRAVVSRSGHGGSSC